MGISAGMEHLQAYLLRVNLRQSEFAALVGSTQATISKLVNGSVQPSLDLAVRIERVTAGAVPATSWVPEAIEPTPPEAKDAAA